MRNDNNLKLGCFMHHDPTNDSLTEWIASMNINPLNFIFMHKLYNTRQYFSNVPNEVRIKVYKGTNKTDEIQKTSVWAFLQLDHFLSTQYLRQMIT